MVDADVERLVGGVLAKLPAQVPSHTRSLSGPSTEASWRRTEPDRGSRAGQSTGTDADRDRVRSAYRVPVPSQAEKLSIVGRVETAVHGPGPNSLYKAT